MAKERRFTTAKCASCGDVIVSRHRHDFVLCRCRSIAVDGGAEYARYVGNFKDFDLTGYTDEDGKVHWSEEGG